MATEKRVTFNEHGEPVVVVTITGWSDAFRFAHAMAHLQTDFCGVARRIGGSLKRKLGAKRFAELHAHYTGHRTYPWIRDGEMPCGRCCNPDGCTESGECEEADRG